MILSPSEVYVKVLLFSPELILLHMEIYYMYDNKIVGASLGGRKTD